MEKAEHDIIEIRPDMLELLESFGQIVHKGQKPANARSLAQLKKNAKKRSHKEALGSPAQSNEDANTDVRLPAKRFRPNVPASRD